jgi:hypothetical protein
MPTATRRGSPGGATPCGDARGRTGTADLRRRLQAEARGFNHGQWALSWAEGDARHLLIVDDSVAAPARGHAGPVPRRAAQARNNRRFHLGLALLVALPLLLLGAALRALDPLTERVVAHVPASVEQHIGEAVLARTRLEGRWSKAAPPTMRCRPSVDA